MPMHPEIVLPRRLPARHDEEYPKKEGTSTLVYWTCSKVISNLILVVVCQVGVEGCLPNEEKKTVETSICDSTTPTRKPLSVWLKDMRLLSPAKDVKLVVLDTDTWTSILRLQNAFPRGNDFVVTPFS
eukprot:CAMPEP_0176005732 /NCGR_PEP_ID=MMETSP0120_2-20121206/2357_1 /TAXON_ID=160619 /ORGANISM="Kryptoperidinium foliaceum, Strain CCMP 1326" /LENGTH=127 /DNA_ID=CAMNT_0017338447 /DNA_START=660 /DNA_END=1040 /DNA_ORIENTATION=+